MQHIGPGILWWHGFAVCAATCTPYVVGFMVGQLRIKIHTIELEDTFINRVFFRALESLPQWLALMCLGAMVYFGGLSLADFGLKPPIRAALPLSLLVFAAAIVGIYILSYVSSDWPGWEGNVSCEFAVAGQFHWVLCLADVVLIGLLGPIVEELAMRGVLLPSLCRLMPWGLAVFVVSGLFALFHANNSRMVVIAAFVLGLAFGLVRVLTDSLYLCIAVHICINLLSVTGAIGDGLRAQEQEWEDELDEVAA